MDRRPPPRHGSPFRTGQPAKCSGRKTDPAESGWNGGAARQIEFRRRRLENDAEHPFRAGRIRHLETGTFPKADGQLFCTGRTKDGKRRSTDCREFTGSEQNRQQQCRQNRNERDATHRAPPEKVKLFLFKIARSVNNSNKRLGMFPVFRTGTGQTPGATGRSAGIPPPTAGDRGDGLRRPGIAETASGGRGASPPDPRPGTTGSGELIFRNAKNKFGSFDRSQKKEERRRNRQGEASLSEDRENQEGGRGAGRLGIPPPAAGGGCTTTPNTKPT